MRYFTIYIKDSDGNIDELRTVHNEREAQQYVAHAENDGYEAWYEDTTTEDV